MGVRRTRRLTDGIPCTYRMDARRFGPCVRPKLSRVSVGWSLLSKGLRGGKERSDRVESLLRRMIASEDAKNPLKGPRATEESKDMALLYPSARRG